MKYTTKSTPTGNIRRTPLACGLVIAAIGLSSAITSASLIIPVQNGGFEDPTPHNPNNNTIADWTAGGWAFVGAPWTTSTGNYGRLSQAAMVGTAQPGPWIMNLNDGGGWVKQNLGTTVTVGDTLAVTFHVMSDTAPGEMTATFTVGATEYSQNFINPQNNGTWVPYTLTKTIGVSGNLSVKFTHVSGRLWLDNISDVTVTSAPPPNGEPTSTNATLNAVEDTEIVLTVDNFGYADPNAPPSPLKAVRITSLPDKGTLKHNTNTVLIGDLPLDVAVADIGTLTYQSALYGYGTPYTTIGIKVESENDLWSVADAVMTVNVSHVNHPPTSTGGSVSMKSNTVKTFAAANFQFSDVDTGDTLQAIEVTSLPVNGGTLKYGLATVSSGDLPLTIPVASIGTLTYTPVTDYSGSDSFDFKVGDGTALSTSAAIMELTITVNQVPTSTGSSVILHTNTVKTFAAANFPFADGDVGDTLQAIKVTSLPAGTLTLNGTPITSAPSADIPVASIGTLTYTPVTDYNGADSFKYQVSDGIDFSADATMAITITSDILVSNGSFETPGTLLGGPWASFGSSWSITGSPSAWQQIKAVDGGVFTSAPDGLWVGLINEDDCPITAPLTQNLGVSVTAGDTLTLTFQSGRQLGAVGGTGVAYFDVDGTKYTMPFDTSTLAAGAWQLTTMTQTITNSGNLTLGFYGTTGHGVNAWIDKVSNVSVSTGGGPTPGSFADWALTNAPGQTPSEDYNNEGVPNGIAYFMGVTGPATNPSLNPSTNTVTWPMSATFSGTFVVETSTDLGTWTPAVTQPTRNGDGNLVFTLPPGAPGGKSFVRLVVTPN